MNGDRLSKQGYFSDTDQEAQMYIGSQHSTDSYIPFPDASRRVFVTTAENAISKFFHVMGKILCVCHNTSGVN